MFVLHYFTMNTLRKLCFIPILTVMLMAACSSPSEQAASSNNNAAQSSGNSAPQPSIAQNGTPTTTNNANASSAATPAPANDKQPAAQPATQSATKQAAVKAPKLVGPPKTIEFGKQPKEKTIVRTFQIRNTGNAELKIDDVRPG